MSKRKPQRDLVPSRLSGNEYLEFQQREQELGRAFTTEEVHALYGRVNKRGQFVRVRQEEVSDA